MLGFAIVDSQPDESATAVWLTSHVEGSRVGNTNAVVIAHDDPQYDEKLYALTADRIVVLTDGTAKPMSFKSSIDVAAFGRFADEVSAHQRDIANAIAEYSARTKNRALVTPKFPKIPSLTMDDRDEPAYRALSVANFICGLWSAWIATEAERLRRTVNPRTDTTPWIMPEELGSQTLADLPPEFAALVESEPLRNRNSHA